MTKEKIVRSVVDLDGLPDQFPTHEHEGAFRESLGRAVATFGFLEEVPDLVAWCPDMETSGVDRCRHQVARCRHRWLHLETA